MRKTLVRAAAVGAVLALRPALARVGHGLRRRCEAMMAQRGGHAARS